ncbi:MAG: DUF11 domain-containing protein, partial [Planctomycetales bacterium]|nr:DUF11 domain-containing protein [Planctomycetales bacterium]
TLAPSSAKTVVDSSLSYTGSTAHNPALVDLVVGETVTFAIQVTVPEGIAPLVVTDQLPTGVAGALELLTVNVNSVGANLTLPSGSPTVTRSDTDSDTLDDRVVLDFGSITNAPDGTVTAADILEIRVTALVVDQAANANGAVLTNTATIDFGSGQFDVTADVEVVEPLLNIDKSVLQTSGPAGSTVHYTVVTTHDAASTSDAFLVQIADLLTDANVTLTAGSVATTSGTVTTGNVVGDTTVAVNVGDLPLGGSVTITFDATINPDLAASVNVVNTSTLAWNSRQDGNGRNGSDSDPATFTTTAPQVDLQITKVDSPDPVTVGDPLQYTLTVVNVGPSTATSVTVVDTLPNVSVTSAVASQGSTNLVGSTLTASLGALRPAETATIVIQATAPSSAQTLVNSATVSSTETDAQPSDNTASEPTEVVETATLSGFNWVDIDRDGTLDPSETPLPGVELTLTGTDYLGNPVSLTTTSLADGSYQFTGLRRGDYAVVQTQPSLFVDGDDYLGTLGGAITGANSYSVSLSPGDDAQDYNFTELGIRTGALSKRLLLVSSLQSAGPPNSTANALDAAFAMLTQQGLADLDNDNDVDGDDFAIFQANLGADFNA